VENNIGNWMKHFVPVHSSASRAKFVGVISIGSRAEQTFTFELQRQNNLF